MINALKKLYLKNKTAFITGCCAIVFLIVAFAATGISSKQLRDLATSAAILGIVALGQMLVIFVGGIDFSMQWLLCSSGILITKLYVSNMLSQTGLPIIALLLIVLAASTAVGCLNGVGIAYFSINPIIMTFCTNVLLHGIMLAWTNGISGQFAPPEITNFLNQSWGGIPVLVYIWAIITVAATFILLKTTFGRKLYAISFNQRAAYYSGIRLKKIKMAAYCISGFVAGLGGILMAANEGRSYLGMGDNMIIQSILVVFIGGTSLGNNRGNYIGTVIGTIALTLLAFLLTKLHIPSGFERMIFGVILMATLIATSPKKTSSSQKVLI